MAPLTKLIVGLGNPGAEYANTRHNAGWWLIDRLATEWRFGAWRTSGESEITGGRVDDIPVRLVKPLTYMNLSGSILRPYLRVPGFSVEEHLLVLVDEIAIPAGEFRLRAGGSAGGHNGLKSIEAHVKTQQYPRLRLGIRPVDERRLDGILSDLVLRVMPKDERALVDEQLPRAVEAAHRWVTKGTAHAVSTMGR
jgi:PTH1 family peptidyl-tRNA hydrolase